MEWLLVSNTDNTQIVMRKEHISIGRSPENDIVIQHDHISRFHAEIMLQGKDYYVVDKGSSNGVWLNGKKIARPAQLKHGDRISFGELEYHFVRVPRP
jgi:pSer/pThr/pTyr-binding forkhead associated (FHA) protein